jgi:type I restriction enzyme M protein
VPENDLPDVLSCWQQRHDEAFAKARAARLSKLKKQIAPLKQDRLKHHAIIHHPSSKV